MDAAEPRARQEQPATRASDQDRDQTAHRLQAAFAEGRLDDAEFDARMRTALTAVTRPELDKLSADLPAAPATAGPASPPRPGKYAIAYKNSIRRGGRWRVPGRFAPVVYKGSGWIDLRAAELTSRDHGRGRRVQVAHRHRVPPGVRVEMDGFGVSKGWSAEEDWESLLPRDAPVVHVRGVAYKGTIEASTRPPATATGTGTGTGTGSGTQCEPLAGRRSAGLVAVPSAGRAGQPTSLPYIVPSASAISSMRAPSGSLKYSDEPLSSW